VGVFNKLSDSIKKGIRGWLNIQPSSPYSIQINEVLDFELSAIRNRIWYRGDSNELEQMYQQVADYADKYKFWAARSTPGMEMRKIHTGLPGLIVRILSSIVLADMNDFEFNSPAQGQLWKEIEEDNAFKKVVERALKEALYIGDGAFKITIDTKVSKYPMIEWVPGERVELITRSGRLQKVIFKTRIDHEHKVYTLYEHYGYGTVTNEVYQDNMLVDFKTFPPTAALRDYEFDKNLMLAVPFKVFDSAKWDYRGGSIFDGKLDNFDAFDESWSQWMDALRKGRAVKYIPEDLIPKNAENGELMKPNPFDNSFLKIKAGFSEDKDSQIDISQPDIPFESYLSSYTTALDLCLQGVISPSTLGIDMKKLDNAEAQREKEKATLYTRNAIVEALQEMLPDLVESAINAYHVLNNQSTEDVEVSIPFGEYANPSFESQVETVSKARTGGIMSIEACVDELYGDSKEDDWKTEEVTRLKSEQGLLQTDPPSVTGYDQKTGDEYESTG